MSYRVALLLFCASALLAPIHSPAQSALPPTLQRGLAQYQTGNLNEAVPLLEEALAEDSSLVKAYPALATALLHTGNPARARTVAQAGRHHGSERTALHLVEAQALVALEDWPAALRAYERAETQHRQGAALPDELSPEQMRARIGHLHRLIGQTKLKSNQFDQARHHLEAARNALPDSVGVHAALAALHLKQQNWRAADQAAQQGLERFPNHPRLLRARSEALAHLDEPDTLLSVLRRLYERQPDNVNVGIAYGRALAANGKPADSREVFETLLDQHPRETKIYDALLAMNERQLNYEGMLRVLQRQRRQFPNDPDLAMRIGRLHERMDDYESARAIYDSTKSLVEPENFTPTLARAQTFVAQDRPDTAAAVYRSVLDRAPDHEEALHGLGHVLEQQAAWTEALDVYQRLQAATDEDPSVHVRLGQVYEELDRPEQALQAYRTAIDQDADHPLPYYRYALLLHRRADRGKADETFAAAERALRKSLRAVEALQRRQLRQIQQSTGGMASLDQTDSWDRSRLEAYDEVAESAFGFLADAFPPERTEPLILDLLDQYESAGRLHHLAGQYYRERGEPGEALHHLQEATREAPRRRAAHLALGALHEDEGAFRSAAQAYERARSLDEEAPDAYRALLRLYRTHGKLDVLIRRWAARYRTDPQNSVLREHLVEALHKADRYDTAREIVQAADSSS